MNYKSYRIISFILAFMLSISCLSTSILAQEGSGEESTEEVEESSTDNQNEGLSESEDVDAIQNDNEEEKNSAEEGNSAEEEIKEEEEVFKEGDVSLLEYLYVNNAKIEVNGNETIVVSFNDAVDSMSLLVENGENSLVLEQSDVAGQLYRFDSTFNTNGSYTIAEIHYELKEENYKIVLSDVDIDAKFGVGQEYDGYDEDEGIYYDLDEESNQEESTQSEEVEAVIAEISGDSEEEAVQEIGDAVDNAQNSTDDKTLMSTISDMLFTDVQAKSNTVICLDPGHGGDDSGATGYGKTEKELNYKIACYLKEDLEKYNDVTVILTHTLEENPSLEQRAKIAANAGADLFVSIHLNATGSGNAYGAEVYYPNTNYNASLSSIGKTVAQNIQNELVDLGIYNRGIKIRTIESDDPYRSSYAYADGSDGDYYGVIRWSKKYGIPGIIVEHCFIDNKEDNDNYLSSDSSLQALASADCAGIVKALGLKIMDTNCYVGYQTHIQDTGWISYAYDGNTSGNADSGKRIEAIRLNLGDKIGCSGSISYSSHVQNVGWQDWVSDGALSGTIGQSLRIEAIKIKLEDDVSNNYDVYYRSYVQDNGWLSWAKNGEISGSTELGYRLEALEVCLVPKDGEAPGDTSQPYITVKHYISYQTHVQNIGWQSVKYDGKMSGTSGQSLRLEGIKIDKAGETENISGNIEYRTHIQNIGWESDWAKNGEMSGTSGKSLRLEAIQIKLTGDLSNQYDVYYRVHAQNIGWMGWAKNGQNAGTAGYSYRLEGIEIVLVKKDGTAPGSSKNRYLSSDGLDDTDETFIEYQTHVQNVGWQAYKKDGATSGTSGQSLRLEGIKIQKGTKLKDYTGDIEYRTHIQNIGWENDWTKNGEMSGTSGQSLRLEAIQINLTGDLAEKYDVYYCVHAQNLGWLDWAKNGESAGTAGYSYRLEAIKIVLVEKDESAPGATTTPFKNASGYSICGNTNTTVSQMVNYFKANNSSYDYFSNYGTAYDGILKIGGAETIEDFCTIYYEEAKAEGINAEVAFCQGMLETGFLKFGNDVLPNQYNYAGIGATGNGVRGNTFSNVREGIRAQIQHLKAYASKKDLKNACVDPRFDYVNRGIAPYVEDLSGKWASSTTYGDKIVTMIKDLMTY